MQLCSARSESRHVGERSAYMHVAGAPSSDINSLAGVVIAAPASYPAALIRVDTDLSGLVSLGSFLSPELIWFQRRQTDLRSLFPFRVTALPLLCVSLWTNGWGLAAAYPTATVTHGQRLRDAGKDEIR